MELTLALTRFAAVARREILRDHLRESCVASTWITQAVFAKLGFPVTVLELVVSVGNGAYSALYREFGRPPRTSEELERWHAMNGAHLVGIGHDQQPGGIGGHLASLVADRFLVDASLDQANDASNAVRVPSVVCLELESSFRTSGIARIIDPDLFVEYVRRPVMSEYQRSPDWGATVQVRDAAASILRQVLLDP